MREADGVTAAQAAMGRVTAGCGAARALGVALAALALACGGGCGGGGGGGGGSDTAVAVVGAAGGTVSGDEGTSVTIPAGALAAPADVTIGAGSAISSATHEAVGPAVAFGPAGASFLVPVRVTLPFDAGRFPGGAFGDLVILRRDDQSPGVIEEIAPLAIDALRGEVSALTSGFSTFQAQRRLGDAPGGAALAVTLDASGLIEGQVTTLTVSRTGSTLRPVEVALSTDDPSVARFGGSAAQASPTRTVTILAGSSVARVDVLAVDDVLIDNDRQTTLRAASPGLTGAAAGIDVVSEDINVPPVAQSATLQVGEDQAQAGALTASDVNLQPLTFALAAQAMRGVVVIDDPATGAFTYTPNANQNGVDSFTFTAADDKGATSTAATITVEIAPVNDPPVASDLAGVATDEEVATSGTLAATDVDLDTLTFTIVAGQGPQKGQVSITDPQTGAFTYTPDADEFGPDSFTFEASDGLASDTGVVTVAIANVNDVPVAQPDSVSATEDSPAAGTLAATDADPADTPSFAVVQQPSKGSVSLNATTGAFTYTPDQDANGPDSFTFTASDDEPSTSPAATVSITIAAVNDAPTLADPADVADDEDPGQVAIPLSGIAAARATAADERSGGSAQALVVSAVSSNEALTGALSAANVSYTSPGATGSLSFTPLADASGQALITVTVTDDGGTALGGDDTTSVAVLVTIAAVNDPPVAADEIYGVPRNATTTIAVADGLRRNAVDVDDAISALTVELVTSVATGTLALAPDGSFSFQPPTDFTGTTTFTYRLRDPAPSLAASNTATVTINVSDANSAPTAADDPSLTVAEAGVLNVPAPGVLANDTDPEGDSLAAVLEDDVSTGTLTLGSDGSLTYTPPDDQFSGVVTFTYRARDVFGAESLLPATATITVTAVNDPPAFAIGNQAFNEDGSVVVDLEAAFSDAETLPDEATYQVIGTPSLVAATVADIAGVLTLTITGNANASGQESITVRATDAGDGDGTGAGAALFDDATFQVTVSPINDAPSFAGLPNRTIGEESDSDVIDLDGFFSDVETSDANASFEVLTTPPSGITASINGTTNVLTITSALSNDFSGSFNLTVRATDTGDGASSALQASDTLQVTVTAENDAPFVQAAIGNISTNEKDTVNHVDLDAVFQDVDDADSALDYLVTSDPSFVTTSINASNQLTLTYSGEGSGNVTVRATDPDGAFASDTFSVTVNAITTTIVTDRDASLHGDNASLANGQSWLFVGRASTDSTRRALVRFNTTGIPAGANVLTASLSMNLDKQNGIATTRAVDIHRLTRNWNEGPANPGGAGGGGAAAVASDVTWTETGLSGINWTTQGGDFDLTRSARSSVSGVFGAKTWTDSDMADDVEGWVSAPSTNFGWIVKFATETGSTTAMRFLSGETGTNSSNRPRISVTYLNP